MAQKDRKHYTPVQSTQKNIPIRDFIDGIIVTKDGRYVKVMEVLPTPFFLKTVNEQNRISDAFESILKVAPDELHLKSISVPADLSIQIKDVENNILAEKNENCKRMGMEYRNTLIQGQEYGIERRFFLSFPYKNNGNMFNRPDLSKIVNSLNTEASRLKIELSACGNEVLEAPADNPNELNAKLFYLLYNRDKYYTKPFSTHYAEVFDRYKNIYKSNDFYIPPTDYIAPDKISYVSSKYLVVNNTYYSFLYIPSYGYNPDVICGWLDNFINSFIGVDVDVFLKKYPKSDVITSIKRSIGGSIMNLNETSEITDTYDASVSSLNASRYLKKGLAEGQDFYYMSTILTVSGESPEEVEEKKEELKRIALQSDIILNENRFLCEESFNAVLPTGMYDESFMKKMRRNVLTEGAASLYPFTSFQLMDKDGLYIADDSNGSPTLIDLFNRNRFNNPHIFICGETGAGKTITLLLIALRARIKHMPVFIIAPEKEDEFRRVCDAIGGQFVSIGSGSHNRINIMDIHMKDELGQQKKKLIDGTSSFENQSYLGEKIATLMEFFQLHILDITLEEKQYLNEAIIEVYKAYGITEDNKSLWLNEDKKEYKKMPVISDLVSALSKKKETYRLSKAMMLLTTGSGAHFDGETNINLNNDFFVIGLEHNTKDMLGLALYMAMDYCWSKIKEDRTRNKFLIIDEWWRLAFNPISADKSLEISKIARAYSCSMVLATQNSSELMAIDNGKYGTAILNNCATKIIMSMKEKDLYVFKEMLNLTSAECSSILRFKAGQGLLIASDNRISLQFNPSDTEKLLTFTDNETLLRYAEYKRREEFMKKKAQYIKETKVKPETKENVLTENDFLSIDEFKNTILEEDC